MEVVIREEVQSFLEEHNLLSKSQHGFRKGRSCISQLLTHTEMMVNALEMNVNLDSVYLDFQKAFDKADHHIILRRCRYKGISGSL